MLYLVIYVSKKHTEYSKEILNFVTISLFDFYPWNFSSGEIFFTKFTKFYI